MQIDITYNNEYLDCKPVFKIKHIVYFGLRFSINFTRRIITIEDRITKEDFNYIMNNYFESRSTYDTPVVYDGKSIKLLNNWKLSSNSWNLLV